MQLAERLHNNLDNLNQKDRKFAISLLKGFDQYGNFTSRQAFWAEKLASRRPQQKEQLDGNFKPLLVMLQFAGQKLKFPKIRLRTEGGDPVRPNRS